jgi:DNA-binding response OmpR family regulator
MARIFVVTDEPWVRNEVHAALSVPGVKLVDHSDPATVAANAIEANAAAVIVDLQVGAMGGMAVARSIRNAEAQDEELLVVLLLDRRADAFLAGRAGADAWVTKPFTARELRDAVGPIASLQEQV